MRPLPLRLEAFTAHSTSTSQHLQQLAVLSWQLTRMYGTPHWNTQAALPPAGVIEHPHDRWPAASSPFFGGGGGGGAGGRAEAEVEYRCRRLYSHATAGVVWWRWAVHAWSQTSRQITHSTSSAPRRIPINLRFAP